MKVFEKEGKVVTIVAGGTVASGSVQIVSDMVGVAENAAATGQEYELALVGVHNLPLDSSTAVAVGDKVDWNGSAVVAAAGGDLLGVALEAKSAASGQTVAVRLNGSF